MSANLLQHSFNSTKGVIAHFSPLVWFCEDAHRRTYTEPKTLVQQALWYPVEKTAFGLKTTWDWTPYWSRLDAWCVGKPLHAEIAVWWTIWAVKHSGPASWTCTLWHRSCCLFKEQHWWRNFDMVALRICLECQEQKVTCQSTQCFCLSWAETKTLWSASECWVWSVVQIESESVGWVRNKAYPRDVDVAL